MVKLLCLYVLKEILSDTSQVRKTNSFKEEIEKLQRKENTRANVKDFLIILERISVQHILNLEDI